MKYIYIIILAPRAYKEINDYRLRYQCLTSSYKNTKYWRYHRDLYLYSQSPRDL